MTEALPISEGAKLEFRQHCRLWLAKDLGERLLSPGRTGRAFYSASENTYYFSLKTSFLNDHGQIASYAKEISVSATEPGVVMSFYTLDLDSEDIPCQSPMSHELIANGSFG